MKSMLEYSKIILEKVSFSKELFHKEHLKFQRILSAQERKELEHWVENSYNRVI